MLFRLHLFSGLATVLVASADSSLNCLRGQSEPCLANHEHVALVQRQAASFQGSRAVTSSIPPAKYFFCEGPPIHPESDDELQEDVRHSMLVNCTLEFTFDEACDTFNKKLWPDVASDFVFPREDISLQPAAGANAVLASGSKDILVVMLCSSVPVESLEESGEPSFTYTSQCLSPQPVDYWLGSQGELNFVFAHRDRLLAQGVSSDYITGCAGTPLSLNEAPLNPPRFPDEVSLTHSTSSRYGAGWGNFKNYEKRTLKLQSSELKKSPTGICGKSKFSKATCP